MPSHVQQLSAALRFDFRFTPRVLDPLWLQILVLMPALTATPGAQSRGYIWATNTPDDTELYGSTLRYPVEQSGAPYNLA